MICSYTKILYLGPLDIMVLVLEDRPSGMNTLTLLGKWRHVIKGYIEYSYA